MGYLSVVVVVFALISGTLSGCASFSAVQSEPSYAIADTRDTRLGRGITAETHKHDAPSGFRLLGNGLDAFATRLLLMEAAEVSLDVQYYLYHDDTTARLFTHYLLRAADRGVRVRLLLDDFGHGGQEAMLSALAEHPNIAVRLFNPFSNRVLPYLDFVTRFSVAHRRMHNKSFIADNQAAIIGGRNIGDTYFSADIYTNFSDLDVLGIGGFASEVSEAFDLYWNHRLAVPIRYLAPEADADGLTAVRTQLDAARTGERSRNYLARLQSLGLLEELLEGQLEFSWAESVLIYDQPDKIINAVADNSGHLEPALKALLAARHSEALIISPYFIPGNTGVITFSDWVNAGARVVVLTNSLAANDVPMVHAGYAAYRKPLIRAGVQLWELRPQPDPSIRRAGGRKRPSDLAGSSRASLHAKTMVFDRSVLFVGSMNLDPRSINLNTEIGVLIFHEGLATHASDVFMAELPRHAWRLDIETSHRWWGQADALVWLDESTWPATPVSKDSEPEASAWSRFQMWLFGLLPIEGLL
ncbi:phospholipase D family protein [Marinobacter sp. X15-166B]|uniref:phospholipase D family protein n=1 Tax=Marinobacter sp. X15-166B TaxID=1897620 RepID=UPI00085C0F8B|nr:phospholipase D family protein [Marinobacter sp. X15-166B]OEY65326.1 hypothetical protein BG841_01845 [Marinobacter sp. X15-166B]